jgi:SAM-dependent methyltransferase
MGTRTTQPNPRTQPNGSARDGSRVYEDRWGATRRIVQMRPHLWRELESEVDGGPVLEVGPGLRPTAPTAGSYFVETSEKAVETLSRAGGRSVRAGDGHLPFRDRSFDAVLALEVLEHVEEDRRLMTEIARVLRPGGRAVISVPLHMARWSSTDVSCAHVRRYEPDELLGKLRDAGLRPERYEVRKARSYPLLAGMGSGILRAMPRFSNWWLQNVVFAMHSGWHRRFGRLRWKEPALPILRSAGGITVVARNASPAR